METPHTELGTHQHLEVPTLAAFVRHRRHHYRETPSAKPERLSRDKLAAAADMSSGYIIKIEQGSAQKPSDSALTRLASALHLSEVERDHLFALARIDAAEPVDTDADSVVGNITKAERVYIDAMNPHLAALVDTCWNVSYANDAYYSAFPGLEEAGNILVWFFTYEESRRAMVEWEAEAQLTVNWFRSFMANYPNDKANRAVFDACSVSPDFMRMWNEEEVLSSRERPDKILRDLETGSIYVVQTRLWRPPAPHDRHVFYLAARTS